MRITILIGAAMLTGCNKSDSRICGSLPMRLPYAAQTLDDQKQATYACVERWAARLSGGRDALTEIADAAVAACDEALVAYNEMARSTESPPSREMDKEFWVGRAKFIAAQARAGNCYPDA